MSTFKIEKSTENPVQPFDPNTLYLIKDGTDKVVPKISNSSGETLHGVSPINKISLDGPLSVLKGLMVTYEITDYDSNRVYNITATSGSIVRYDYDIEYTAPDTVGLTSIIINGVAFNINIINPVVNKPTILVPVPMSIDVNISNVQSICSDFNVTDGATDEFESSDWQLATDVGFINMVDQIAESTDNEIIWTLPLLDLNTTYYIRTRHKGVSLGYSEWSTPASFTTAETEFIGMELFMMSADVGVSIDSFGYIVDITPDGTRAFVAAFYNGDDNLTDPGIVYVYTIENNAMVYETELLSVDPASNDLFGNSLSSSTDGSVLVVGCANDGYSSYTDNGSVYVYTRLETAWSLTQQILNPEPGNNKVFGNTVSVSGDGNTIVIGAPTNNQDRGTTYVYEKSGPDWVLTAALFPPNASGNSQTGYNVKISNDGTRIISGCYYGDGDQCAVYFKNNGVWEFEASITTSGTFGNGFNVSINADGDTIAIGSCYDEVGTGPYYFLAGRVLIYTRTGSIWSLQTTLTASDPADGDYFGSVVELSQTGDKILISCRNDDLDYQTNVGSVYVFTRVGSVWTQEHVLIANLPITDFSFGSSLKCSGDGSLAIIGSNNVSTNISTGGNVYLYTI
jgi:hypothetical protein